MYCKHLIFSSLGPESADERCDLGHSWPPSSVSSCYLEGALLMTVRHGIQVSADFAETTKPRPYRNWLLGASSDYGTGIRFCIALWVLNTGVLWREWKIELLVSAGENEGDMFY